MAEDIASSMMSIAAPQEVAQATSIALITNGSTQIVKAGVNGTVNAIAMNFLTMGGPSGQDDFIGTLVDGNGKVIWSELIGVGNNVELSVPIHLSGLRVPFVNGLSFTVANSTVATGSIGSVNIYYAK